MAKPPLNRAGRASSVGIEFSIAVVGFMLVGWWLDERFGLSPYGTLGGLAFGSLIGFRSLWQMAKASAQED